jgi:excisionase family DNA binding protein
MGFPTVYTPEEVASQLRVTRRTVYQWLSSAELQGLRSGHFWRITEEEVLGFLQRHARPRKRQRALDGTK